LVECGTHALAARSDFTQGLGLGIQNPGDSVLEALQAFKSQFDRPRIKVMWGAGPIGIRHNDPLTETIPGSAGRIKVA
jgi:hypothetical protein